MVRVAHTSKPNKGQQSSVPILSSKLEKLFGNRRNIEKTEVYSFLLVLFSLELPGTLFFIATYSWLFLLLAALDAYGTYLRVQLFLFFARGALALSLLVLTSTVSGLGVLPIIFETIALIGLIDFSFLLRKMDDSHAVKLAKARSKSYFVALLPTFAFSVGLVYVYSILPLPIDRVEPILVLGIASTCVFLAIFLINRFAFTSQMRR